MQFQIENMTCGGCAKSVTKAILSVDPSAKVVTDPGARKVEVASDQPRAAFEAVLQEAGYPAAAAA
jgi:copper chaperone